MIQIVLIKTSEPFIYWSFLVLSFIFIYSCVLQRHEISSPIHCLLTQWNSYVNRLTLRRDERRMSNVCSRRITVGWTFADNTRWNRHGSKTYVVDSADFFACVDPSWAMSLGKRNVCDKDLVGEYDVILCVLFILPDVNRRDAADHRDSCESFHSCRSAAGT